MAHYVFLTGHRKAGTTLLMSLFDGHKSATSYPSDISLFYAYFPGFTGDPKLSDAQLKDRLSLVLRKSLEGVKTAEGAQDFIDAQKLVDLFWKHFGTGDLRSRPHVLDTLGRAWCEYAGRSFEDSAVVFKETSQSIFFGELLAAFPEIRMIHLMRDPRDNYAALKAGVSSYYAKLGENELATLASLINRARMDMIAARVNRERHPNRFAVVRFEDLVADPKPEMERLCKFLGWEFDEAMLAPTVMGRPQSGNSHEGKAFTAIDRSNAGAWSKRISPEEAKVIEYWCSNEMRDWGYEPAFPETERQQAFADFYGWYNTRYFFSDSFAR
jgi:hypothetical protein